MKPYGILFLVLAVLSGCAAIENAAAMSPVAFSHLPGFANDQKDEALAAFLQSCNGAPPVANASAPFTPGAWKNACAAAKRVPLGDKEAAERFFTSYFRPYRVQSEEAHYTGYYVPVLQASLTRGGAYRYPAYAMPPEISASPSASYYDRAAIDGGALAGRGLELVWCNDPVMLFFAHVQGSATVQLPDGTLARLAFAGKNGREYHAIGRTLVESGALTPEEVSLHTIRDWLYAHPEEAAQVMQTNPSYIFFTLEKKTGAVRGAHGTPLTPGRSLAVDAAYIPLGLPLYISTQLQGAPYNRIVIAADTGSAIKGAARGDIFFGYGKQAEDAAGTMNAGGELYLLLPKDVSHE